MAGPELLEMRTAPGGTIGGLMVGAAWFNWGDEEDTTWPSRFAADDPLHDLSYAAYLGGEAESAMAATVQPAWLREQFQVDVTRWSTKGREPATPTTRELETAQQLAKDLLVHAVDSLSRGSIQDYDWIDQLPIFDDLVTAFASHDMAVMRAGFTPFGVNDGGSGQQGWQSSAASGGEGNVTSGTSAPSTSVSPVARPHGDIQPLRLSPPPMGDGSSRADGEFSPSLITTLSGGSGGSGGGDPPIAIDDYFVGLHDETMQVADNGVLWNDYLGDEPGSPYQVSPPSHAVSFSFSTGGGFAYVPPSNWKGTDSFTYTISNSQGTSDPATVFISITNTPPATGSDAYSALTNTELVIPSSRWPAVGGLLENDTDGDGDSISVSNYTQPEHGSITVASDGSFSYLPETDYAGQDTFTYRITDGVDESANQTVTIQVSQPLVDLDTDSDNNGNIEGSTAEDLMETTFPGKIIARNSDNDNDNSQLDLDDVPMTAGPNNDPYPDDDLFPLEIAVETAIPQTDGFTFTIEVSNTLRLWEERTKDTAILTGHTYTVGVDVLPSSQYPLYVEGYTVGNGTITGTLKNNAGVQVNQDSVSFLVVEMDIDVDSNNNGTVEPGSTAEDVMEDRPGTGVNEVGARVFANWDDDNRDSSLDLVDVQSDYVLFGLEDNDFTEVKLNALGVQGLVGYSLWLGIDEGAQLWANRQKLPLSYASPTPTGGLNRPTDTYPMYDPGCDSWYYWNIDSSGASFPETLYFEGKELESEHVYWRLVKPGGSGVDTTDGDVLARDTVEVNVERMVWPDKTQTDPQWYDKEPTQWDGVVVPFDWILEDATLIDFIKNEQSAGPSIQGKLVTPVPNQDTSAVPNDWFDLRTSEGDDAPTTGVMDFTNGFVIELEYGFERLRGDFETLHNSTPAMHGYVRNPDHWRPGFVGNSGVKFNNATMEAAILDVEAYVELAGGINSFNPNTPYDSTVIASNGMVDIDNDNPVTVNHEFEGGIDQTFFNAEPFEPRELDRLLTGVLYHGGNYEEIEDFVTPSPPAQPYESADYYNALERNVARANEKIRVDVYQNGQGGYELEIYLDDDLTYHQTFATWQNSSLWIQAHWGSGVSFSSMDITERPAI